MPKRVVKKDGSEEEFIPEKITTSVMKSGLDLQKARKIARAIEEEFKNREKIRSKEIRNIVIKELNKEGGIIDESEPDDALEDIEEAEQRLHERASWGSQEILLKSFSSTTKFNDFSRKISKRDNVVIKDIDRFDNEIIVEVIVLPPNRSIH